MLREQSGSLGSVKDFTCISSSREMLENSFAAELSGSPILFVHIFSRILKLYVQSSIIYRFDGFFV